MVAVTHHLITMIFQFIILFILLLLATSEIYVFSFSSNETDHQALLSFKASLKESPLGALDSWNNSIHFCQWNGVTCNTRQRVTALNLSSQNLVGTFSPHIGNLSFLMGIYLSHNNFHGSIPNEIGRLSHLQYLYLDQNSFEGGFPANLSHCVDIRNISMKSNDLEGQIPIEFASWSKLDLFVLRDNHFSNSIPASIGNISSLRYLDLSLNNLVGGIPLELSHHTKLQVLALGTNNFSGKVPPPLYNISSLYVFALEHNALKGTLPSNLGFTLPKLEEFYAASNSFTGPIPQSIANASKLFGLEISKNSITGPIPNNLGSLPDLQLLNLGQNPLGDHMQPGDLSFFDSLVNCTHLKILSLYETNLTGELRNSIVNFSTTMELLYLHENHIYGSIPHRIGNLVNMTVLSLSGNLLTGTIPESIGELSKLGVLYLHRNNISGFIPTSISNITQLSVLHLQNNMLQGSIPTELFNISSPERVSLANNRLRGVIPEEIGFFSHCVHLNLSENQFSGPLPSNIGSLKQLVVLDVSNNKLRGDIPATLGDCVMLEMLYMEGNLFQGKIPSSFKALKSLVFLDLSKNNISGDIPSFFVGFRLINFLNLSHNKLKGEVPGKGIFSNVTAFSLVGNLELCGGITALHLHVCMVSRNKSKTFAIRTVLLVSVPLIILLACLCLICYRYQNSKKLDDPIPEDSPFLKLSHRDLWLATEKFSPNNLLGEGRYGSVYKGVLKSLELTIAVKVLNVEVSGCSKSFLAECETLSTVRHRNLIKIITTCSSTDFEGNVFKALVFEFMSNGSVDNWLHPSPPHQGNKKYLTLLQRINISIDVALGLDYLHHHSHASIIHSDIKPSNILLDEEFVAHIGDFGLARFSFATTSDVNQAQMSSTSVHGTIGYVPPEYGMGGEISTKGDVYSYGIFLLEIFSGKRPTDSSILIHSVNNLHDYVRKVLPHRVLNIVDPQILLDQEELGLATNTSYNMEIMEVCLGSIFEVGILCSQEMPQKRIDIKVAIKHLDAARDKLLHMNLGSS